MQARRLRGDSEFARGKAEITRLHDADEGAYSANVLHGLAYNSQVLNITVIQKSLHLGNGIE
jgi:hypothetical protein